MQRNPSSRRPPVQRVTPKQRTVAPPQPKKKVGGKPLRRGVLPR